MGHPEFGSECGANCGSAQVVTDWYTQVPEGVDNLDLHGESLWFWRLEVKDGYVRRDLVIYHHDFCLLVVDDKSLQLTVF